LDQARTSLLGLSGGKDGNFSSCLRGLAQRRQGQLPAPIALVMRDVFLLTGIGIAIGLLAAWGLTRVVRSQLYGIQPNDALTIAAATMGITFVALLAGYLPARRATRVDPMRALRWE
jgi:predicted lysophospholipase L1 biosynthesis ABC-type transport system permease subunit